MKVKCIIVDEVPERCEDCLFYNRPYTEDDSKCDLDYINHAACLLVKEEITMTKEEWINRFRKRGNDEKFISFISDNWDKFIDDIEKDDYPTKHVLHDDLYGDHRYINSVTVSELFECLCYAKNEQEGSSATKKIRGWDDLDGLESEHFKITVDRASCNGHIEW